MYLGLNKHPVNRVTNKLLVLQVLFCANLLELAVVFVLAATAKRDPIAGTWVGRECFPFLEQAGCRGAYESAE